MRDSGPPYEIFQGVAEANLGDDEVVVKEVVDHLERLEVLQHGRLRFENHVFQMEYR